VVVLFRRVGVRRKIADRKREQAFAAADPKLLSIRLGDGSSSGRREQVEATTAGGPTVAGERIAIRELVSSPAFCKRRSRSHLPIL
jgi:hypothetical protein